MDGKEELREIIMSAHVSSTSLAPVGKKQVADTFPSIKRSMHSVLWIFV
jgi:hypothetical protein